MKIKALIVNIIKSRALFFIFSFLIFFCISILFRLPHFLSNAFWFDGDEGIIGIMAQDFLAGRSFPMYFYGQNYGLSIFEVSAVAIWIKLIGTGIWALRLGGLTLFALGTTFIFKGLINRGISSKISFAITLGVLCFPTWMLWGSMVRGGYVTALCAISILFFLTGKIKFTLPYHLLIGFVLAVAFESHAFLLIPILPLLLLNWFEQKGNILNLFKVLVIWGLFVIVLKSLNFQTNYWSSPALNLDFSKFSERINIYGKGILNSFGSFYFYTINIEIPGWWQFGLGISFILLLFLLINSFIGCSKTQKLFFLFSLLLMLPILFVALSMKNYTPRYMISIYTGVLFILLFFPNQLINNRLNRFFSIRLLFIFLIGIGVGSKFKRDFSPSDANKINAFSELHKVVINGKYKGVFVCDNLMQWQWNYLYGNEIPANGFRLTERTMRFTKKVESIYNFNPKKTAIVGYWGLFYGIDYIHGFNDTRKQIANDYFIQPIVTKAFHDRGYLEMGE